MMTKLCARRVKTRSLRAISELSRILSASKGQCSAKEFGRLKKAVGSCIGHIERQLLVSIYSEYPELDDLK